jgi:hypothetical protein
MTKSGPRPIRIGDNVVRNVSTHDQGTVRLGDNTPTFRAGDKAAPDTATVSKGKVRLADEAPVFAPKE